MDKKKSDYKYIPPPGATVESPAVRKVVKGTELTCACGRAATSVNCNKDKTATKVVGSMLNMLMRISTNKVWYLSNVRFGYMCMLNRLKGCQCLYVC